MPMAAMKPCAYPGCANLVRHGRCDLHRAAEVVYRDAETQRLYGTARWHRIRRLQLTRQPWCEDCLRANIYTKATDVDHIEPHRGDAVKFFTGKVQSLCHICHSRKTQQEVFG